MKTSQVRGGGLGETGPLQESSSAKGTEISSGGGTAQSGVSSDRDICRKFLGPQLVIVILTMQKEHRRKRLEKRHKEEDTELVDVLMVICEFRI